MKKKKSETTNEKRSRLSIDLEAYPDVKEMLANAVAATGCTPTELTMNALRCKLPMEVMRLRDKIIHGSQDFLNKYPAPEPLTPDMLNDAECKLAALFRREITSYIKESRKPASYEDIVAATATADKVKAKMGRTAARKASSQRHQAGGEDHPPISPTPPA